MDKKQGSGWGFEQSLNQIWAGSDTDVPLWLSLVVWFHCVFPIPFGLFLVFIFSDRHSVLSL
jgi:hypothetical protein